MTKSFNKAAFKILMAIGFLSVVPALLLANPLVGGIILILAAMYFIPGFRPFAWISRAVGGLFRGITRIIAAIFGGIFAVIRAIIVGVFKTLAALFGLASSSSSSSSGFMGAFDRWKVLRPSHTGLYVDGHKRRLSEKASFESVLTVGGMGRGKSTVFVIPNLLRLNGPSFVVSDTSGEIYAKTSGAMAAKGYRIRVLNLMEPSRSETYNPLANARDYTAIGQAAEIIIRSALPGPQKDAFWNAGAEKIIRIMIQCLHNLGDPAHTHLASVKYLLANFDAHLTQPGQLGRIDRFVMNATQNDPSTFTDYQGFVAGNAKTMLSFLTTADTALNAIGNPAIASLTATSSIDFQELRDQKTALYVLVRQQDMAYYQFLLNLFYTDLFGHLLGSVQPNARPVYLLLDEFGHLAIPNFNVFATTARKYNVGFWLFLQSLSQLEARYGPHDAETILDGLQTEIYLPGVNLDTARRLEQRLGQIADPSGQGRRQPLLTADQIIRMKDGRALLLHSNKRPAMLKTRPYFRQGALRRAADKPAASMRSNTAGSVQMPIVR